MNKLILNKYDIYKVLGGGIMVIHTDVFHLDDAIDYYKMKNFGTRPYIFMNEDTMKGLGYINAFTRVFEYDGCRVFEDVNLDTREVELR